MNRPNVVKTVAIAVIVTARSGARSYPWISLRFLEGRWEGKQLASREKA